MTVRQALPLLELDMFVSEIANPGLSRESTVDHGRSGHDIAAMQQQRMVLVRVIYFYEIVEKSRVSCTCQFMSKVFLTDKVISKLEAKDQRNWHMTRQSRRI